ncbi:nicotinamide riboside transporter PnuC [Solicola gregarius]|uniref:Nicotinamide riboside transporter PnuC n=1 Tax=Solicola gregarius TaxID=2908642 RepID=A0AA46YK23_9ACTN|nr:nicotinamide riboside transporter PnuC [Solicola gregarius]UYM05235.1 nicotinamide riboside transporter PnuC [Solicola gregarius]
MLDWLLEGTIAVGGGTLLVREIVGNGFGIASALLGSRRSVAAWPVGIVGNLILFTVFVGGVLSKPQVHDLWGQAGRQVFFMAVSVYGWQRWRQRRARQEAGDGSALVPGWAGRRGLVELALLGVVGMLVFYPTLRALGSWGPLGDAWILTGSILATYGMARGWIEFWIIWIAVDAVGVPLLVRAEYYPSAALYLLYGAFCVYGFVAWLRARRRALAAGGRTSEVTA